MNRRTMMGSISLGDLPIAGYTGDFFTLKNSWATDWGGQGYCNVPKSLLAASDPEFVAVLLKQPD